MNLIMQDISRPAVRQAIRRELADPAAIIAAKTAQKRREMGAKLLSHPDFNLSARPWVKPMHTPGSAILNAWLRERCA